MSNLDSIVLYGIQTSGLICWIIGVFLVISKDDPPRQLRGVGFLLSAILFYLVAILPTIVRS
jgi:hypothetical protein